MNTPQSCRCKPRPCLALLLKPNLLGLQAIAHQTARVAGSMQRLLHPKQHWKLKTFTKFQTVPDHLARRGVLAKDLGD